MGIRANFYFIYEPPISSKVSSFLTVANWALYIHREAGHLIHSSYNSSLKSCYAGPPSMAKLLIQISLIPSVQKVLPRLVSNK
jgi:hypothetical protein